MTQARVVTTSKVIGTPEQVKLYLSCIHAATKMVQEGLDGTAGILTERLIAVMGRPAYLELKAEYERLHAA